MKGATLTTWNEIVRGAETGDSPIAPTRGLPGVIFRGVTVCLAMVGEDVARRGLGHVEELVGVAGVGAEEVLGPRDYVVVGGVGEGRVESLDGVSDTGVDGDGVGLVEGEEGEAVGYLGADAVEVGELGDGFVAGDVGLC